jgi:hypothetical protein
MNTRRKFLAQLAAGAAGSITVLATRSLAADGPARLEENDPTAMALGYKRDTTKVDGKKYSQHKPDQKCVGCLLYTGKPDGAEGPCGAFAGKLVAGPGWCVAYAKKP